MEGEENNYESIITRLPRYVYLKIPIHKSQDPKPQAHNS